MKVLHVIEALSGGAPITIQYLTEELRHLEHVIVYSTRNEEIDTPEVFKQFPDYVRFVKWPHVQRELHPVKDWQAVSALMTIIRAEQPEILHLHSSKAGFLGRLANLLGNDKPQKVLYTPNGAAFNRKDVGKLKRLLYGFFEQVGNWMGGRVVSCSSSEQASFRQFGIRAELVNNGVLAIAKGVAAATPTIDRPKLTVGTVGRLTFQKNPQLFNQIAHACANDPGIQFIWIGAGELRNQLDAPNVRVTGWLNRGQVMQELQGLDIYLSTALWEGLPFSVLEAMVAAKPLLLNACVGNVDLVEQGENGFVFHTPEQAVGYLQKLRNGQLDINAMGAASKRRQETYFTATQMAARYLELYLG